MNVFAFLAAHFSLPCWLHMKFYVFKCHHIRVIDNLAFVSHRQALFVEVVVDLYSHNFN